METIANMNPGPKQRSYPLPSTLRDQNRAIRESAIRNSPMPTGYTGRAYYPNDAVNLAFCSLDLNLPVYQA